ncbi:hypothetical protein DIC66_12320 [Rhodoferax lacus]|uniref:Uncharacterized protein n=1 Tax=Rhodoferax lacus TaxID=2184758 RepID=A0A3E1RBP9_9BURK|nr:hypothetical protein DIC66_12320 [Rhodoferax lacus]
MPEAWVRRGAMEDLVILARLYDAMKPETWGKFMADLEARHNSPNVADVLRPIEHDGSIAALVRFLEWYAESTDRLTIMTVAVHCLASQRLVTGAVTTLSHDDVHEWLSEVAESEFPLDDEIRTLMGFVSDRHCDGYRPLLVDGWLDAVLCTSDGEYDKAESIYINYEYTRSTDLLGYDMPAPAQFLQVRVEKQDFSVFDFETGWHLDQDAYDQECRHQCILKFTSYVGWWRSRFLECVLSDESVVWRPSSASPTDSRTLADFSEESLEAIIDAAMTDCSDGGQESIHTGLDRTSILDTIPGIAPLLDELSRALSESATTPNEMGPQA